jgi:hypothetical protein
MKMRPVETVPGIGDEGEWGGGEFIIRTCVKATMHPTQHSNTGKKDTSVIKTSSEVYALRTSVSKLVIC